jgi:hypothetical protein
MKTIRELAEEAASRVTACLGGRVEITKHIAETFAPLGEEIERLKADASRMRLAHEKLRERLAKAEVSADRYANSNIAHARQNVAHQIELASLRSEIARKDEALKLAMNRLRLAVELVPIKGDGCAILEAAIVEINQLLYSSAALAPPAQEAKNDLGPRPEEPHAATVAATLREVAKTTDRYIKAMASRNVRMDILDTPPGLASELSSRAAAIEKEGKL